MDRKTFYFNSLAFVFFAEEKLHPLLAILWQDVFLISQPQTTHWQFCSAVPLSLKPWNLVPSVLLWSFHRDIKVLSRKVMDRKKALSYSLQKKFHPSLAILVKRRVFNFIALYYALMVLFCSTTFPWACWVNLWYLMSRTWVLMIQIEHEFQWFKKKDFSHLHHSQSFSQANNQSNHKFQLKFFYYHSNMTTNKQHSISAYNVRWYFSCTCHTCILCRNSISRIRHSSLPAPSPTTPHHKWLHVCIKLRLNRKTKRCHNCWSHKSVPVFHEICGRDICFDRTKYRENREHISFQSDVNRDTWNITENTRLYVSDMNWENCSYKKNPNFVFSWISQPAKKRKAEKHKTVVIKSG